MNILFIFGPFIRALRRKSLTFALVFATALLGLSVAGVLRQTFTSLGLWLPLAWILPLVAIGYLAKWEEKLPLRTSFKRGLCYLLVFGSIILSVTLWRYEASIEKQYPELQEERERPRQTGPRGKHTSIPHPVSPSETA